MICRPTDIIVYTASAWKRENTVTPTVLSMGCTYLMGGMPLAHPLGAAGRFLSQHTSVVAVGQRHCPKLTIQSGQT